MGSLKTLHAASLAATLATTLATFAAGTAIAADMPAPPPPMMTPAPMMDAGGGFYLRGDIGMGTHNYGGLDNVPAQANYNTLTNSLDSTAILGFGAGYAFNSWLRADATVEYRTPSKFHLFEQDTQGTPAGADDGFNLTKGKMSAIVGLANAYVDLGTWHRITPYLGLGIGFANIHMTGVTDTGFGAFAGGSGRASDKSTTNMAWAVHAGLSYDLSSNLKADVGYRYLNMGSVNSGTVICTVPCAGYNARIKNLESHDIKVGMRYMFSDVAAPLMSAPGPLMRKY